MALSSVQETAGVYCKRSSGITGDLIDGSIETRQLCRQIYQHRNQNIQEPLWLNGPAWLLKSELKWQKPWCQENEVELEQVTSTVATENKLYQLFNLRQDSTFNRIRKFTAYCLRFETNEKGPLKADEIHQAEKILFRFVQNKIFPNVSKSIEISQEIAKTLKITKLSPFTEKDGTIGVKCRLMHYTLITMRNTQYCQQRNIQLYNFCWRKHIETTYMKAKSM